MKRKILTLCFLRKGDEILLGYKKRGFGMGKWNGFGGKVEKDETIEDASRREMFEEAGVSVNEIRKFATVEFTFEGKENEILEAHFFEAKKWAGEPAESEEMKPEWFSIDKIPYKKMWSDDKYWFPLYLEGKNFVGKIHFDKNDQVLSHKIEVL